MTDAFNKKRGDLEEEYFHRQNQEAIEKLRAKMKIAADAKAAGTSSMRCPRCDGTLVERLVNEVSIDTCDKCGGTWLDLGEMEQIVKREGGGFFSRLFGGE